MNERGQWILTMPLLLVAACASHPPSLQELLADDRGPWLHIGVIGSDDAEQVERTLRERGIASRSEGSVVNGLWVRESDCERALHIMNDLDGVLWRANESGPIHL